jgi:hypothetical protein
MHTASTAVGHLPLLWRICCCAAGMCTVAVPRCMPWTARHYSGQHTCGCVTALLEAAAGLWVHLGRTTQGYDARHPKIQGCRTEISVLAGRATDQHCKSLPVHCCISVSSAVVPTHVLQSPGLLERSMMRKPALPVCAGKQLKQHMQQCPAYMA